MAFLKPNVIAAVLAIILSFPLCTGDEGKVGAFDGEIVRLHIIANSDGAEDQMLKLKVRDKILEAAEKSNNAENIAECVKANKNKFLKIAADTLRENNSYYDVTAETGVFSFPARQYGDLYFPKGEYNALKIIIGEGKGHNWWCVMYPPLCFTDKSDGELTEENKKLLSKNTEDVITKPKYKFKIAELFGK